MVHDLLQGLGMVFSFPAFLYMLVAVFLGLFIGVLPGVGGLFALAMLIPFIYGMQPAEAFAFLLGAHAVVATGGAITSILFNTPGEGPTTALVFDGFPLAKMGKASQALGAGMSASAIGGVLGALFLLISIPVMEKVVLAFGPPEFFMMSLLGVIFIASLGSGSMTKSLIAGGLGLMLSLVGFDPMTGIVRYDFNWLYLWEGIDLVPVVIGLFAVAEVIELAAKGGGLLEANVVAVEKGTLEGVRETLRRWWLVVRCSALGTIIGFIPGLGGDVATFMSYGHAMQTSKSPERFGKGNIDGVIAPLSAVNAKEGGALIPTVAFGIPGSAGMAILLGAFYIVGLQPGPEMLQTQRPFLFSLVWTLIVANIIASCFMLLVANRLAVLTSLRGSILVPVILVFAVLGTFSTSADVGNIIISIVMGFIGYEMKRQNYSRACLIIGLVLGKITEQNLNLSIRLYGWEFLLRPITMLILLAIVITLLSPLIRKTLARRRVKISG